MTMVLLIMTELLLSYIILCVCVNAAKDSPPIIQFLVHLLSANFKKLVSSR